MYFSPSPAHFAPGPHHAGMPFPATTPSWPVSSASTTSTTRVLTMSSASTNGTIPTYSWAHTVPTYMPWVPKSESSTIQPVMRFTAPLPPDPCTSQTATSWELLHNLGACSGSPGANQHLKRRSDSPTADQRPFKQYVSEEKMAARFDQLHISNEHFLPAFSSLIPPDVEKSENVSNTTNHDSKPVKAMEQLETLLADDSSEDSDADEKVSPKGTVVLDPQLKRIVSTDMLVSKSILSEMQKPSLALVLWQPPGGVIPRQIQSVTHPPPHFSSSDGSLPLRDAMIMENAESNNNSTQAVDLNSINSYRSHQEHNSSPSHVESPVHRTVGSSFPLYESRISQISDDDMEL